MSYDPNVPPVPPTGPAPAQPYPTPTTEGRPLPLGEAIRQLPTQYWQALTRPNAAFYAEEKGKAAWDINWVQIAILAVLGVIFSIAFYYFIFPSIISTFVVPMLRNNPSIPPGTTSQIQQRMMQNMQVTAIPSSLSNLIAVPLSIFISVGILHLIAKAFRGTGTFIQYMYGYLLYAAPITIVTYVLGWIPILGWIIAFALGIYHIVLTVFMTMGVHRLSGGKATLVVLLPFIVVLALACCVIFSVFGLIGAAMQHR